MMMNNEDNQQRPMKVALVCNSDNLGGAAIMTRRLMHALRNEGVDARMVVFNKLSNDEHVDLINAGRFHRGWAFMAERAQIALANGLSHKNLFKVSTASHGLDPLSDPTILQADVIVLSWINQGVMSLKGIERLARMGKPIVWMMHDMWTLTGICHHAFECGGYENECGRCEFLGAGAKKRDLSHRVWKKKKRLYQAMPNATFVGVSNWLAECAKRSSLLKDADVRVIPNAFPIDSFFTQPTMPLHMLPRDKKVILMGAARLDDPIKGLDMAIEALNKLFDNDPKITSDTVAVFFGTIRNKSLLDKLRFPHVEVGTINDAVMLRQLYARASVVLSTSLYESLQSTLIEGQASGCLPVTFGRGGQKDIVDHLVNGYIARYCDTDDVAAGIKWALTTAVDRKALHQQAADRFSSHSVAQKYISLFNELIEKNK